VLSENTDESSSVIKEAVFWNLLINSIFNLSKNGIIMPIKTRVSITKITIKVPTFTDTYYTINFTHLQAAFYLLVQGNLLEVYVL